MFNQDKRGRLISLLKAGERLLLGCSLSSRIQPEIFQIWGLGTLKETFLIDLFLDFNHFTPKCIVLSIQPSTPMVL